MTKEKLVERFRKCGLPEHMLESTVEYVLHGRPIGGFMAALFSNDLMGAFLYADDKNRAAMERWVRFLYWQVPSNCHGSKDLVEAWIEMGGLEGD